MSKVIIIGAGGVGQVVTHKCAQAPDVFSEIILASRTIEKCDKIAKQIGPQIRTAQIDADDVPALTELLIKEKPKLVINVALPYQDLHIMDACLAAGVHYLDTANYEPLDEAKFEYSWQWAYQDKFKEAGLMALLGSGFDPGVTNVFTAWALKKHFDEIYELDIIDCNDGDHGHPFATNFNPEINIREVTAKGRYYQEGKWIETDPLSVKKSFDFPEGIGPKNIYLMYHEELESLTKHIPTIKKARFWMTFSDNYLKHLEVLENVGMTGIEPIEYQGQEIVPLQFLKALLPDPSSLGKVTKGRTCIGCKIKGVKDGQEKEYYIYNICDHEKAFAEVKSQAISYTTGVPAMIGAMMMLTDTWKGEGVFNMEELDPEPFMKKLNEHGLPWQENYLIGLNPEDLPSPSFVIDEIALENNLRILQQLEKESGAKVLLALKAFASTSCFPLIKKYLSGICASGPYEARLGYEEFSKEVHSYTPAYTKESFLECIGYSNHLVLNSFNQWNNLKSLIPKGTQCQFGIRINPQHSEVDYDIYDPCSKGSRLGVSIEQFRNQDLEGLSGLHMHTLCESGAEALERTIKVLERDYSEILKKMKWLNLGGGHLITYPKYNYNLLSGVIIYLKDKYQLQIYLEPGEAVVINTGALVCTVLDIIESEPRSAIVDISVTCHMPDVIEMPYRPEIEGAAKAGEFEYLYAIGGLSCLAGDVLGEYSFPQPLKVGDRLVIEDMSHYTTVKTTHFNGVPLPSYCHFHPESKQVSIKKEFAYDLYRNRLS